MKIHLKIKKYQLFKIDNEKDKQIINQLHEESLKKDKKIQEFKENLMIYIIILNNSIIIN